MLLDFQRRMAADVMRPVTASDSMARSTDASYVKPNSRLTARERLEIYNRQYWYRVLDSLYEDFPGLRVIAGESRFTKLSEAYIRDCPSASFTLRNLGSGLEAWLRANPKWAGRRPDLAFDMAALEWAHIEAFDNESRKEIGPEDLAELNPGMRMGLQPYVRLLSLQYPVDDLRVHINSKTESQASAANAASVRRRPRKETALARISKAPVFVAVHRHDGYVYYRRLDAGEFALLKRMEQGGRLSDILDPLAPPQNLEGWFTAWARLGWLCHPATRQKAGNKRPTAKD